MSEIKSTLELVLEKTRDMTLSREDKQEQLIREFREKVNGLLHAYLEGLASLDQFQRQFSSLEAPSGSGPEKILAEEAAQRLELPGDNDKLLEVLSRLCGVKLDGVESALCDHQQRLRALEKERAEAMCKALKERFRVHGRAVRANLEGDSGWVQTLSEAREAFLEELKREVLSQIGS